MNKELLTKIINDSLAQNIPILRPQSFKLLVSLLQSGNYKSILEIGSATGVTAFRLENIGYNVTSIEHNDELYKQCLFNKKLLDSKTVFLFGDAKNYLFQNNFDVVFIDGAKAHYQAFFDNALTVNPRLIFIDNINFGINDITSYPKRLQPICKKMKLFIQNIKNDTRFIYDEYLIEDGVIVLTKK